MSKETENHSFNERNSLTGSSGMLGLSSFKPKFQPIRIKAFLDMYTSDDEDSEDRGKESNSDSDCDDDVQPLPEDENREECLTTVTEETTGASESPIIRVSADTAERLDATRETAVKTAENFQISRKFVGDSEECRRREAPIAHSANRPRTPDDHSSKDPRFVSNRRSNVQLEAPSVPKIESATCGPEGKYESACYTGERQEARSEGAQGCASRYVTDTPMKNHPPVGSARPTPSVSHRSMFQTPRSAMVPQADSRQTPATIFGNWSRNHMARTPLESREGQPASLVSQVPTNHEASHGSYEERKVRRPLAETAESVRCNRQSSRSDRSFAHRYNAAELINDASSNGEAVVRDSKENRRPPSPLEGHEPPSYGVESSRSEASTNPPANSSKDSDKNNSRNEAASHEKHPSLPPIAAPPDKKSVPERRNNVQVSIASRMRRPSQGQTITVKDKEYLILGILGEGMSGQVLRVQEVGSLDLRAIKVVDLSRMDKDCAQGCLQEISMLHKLQAPCIVKMFDHEIKYPMVHVVLEMGDTDFKSLLISMSEKNRLPLTMILYYWTEMLTAVKHIHDNGVIHSDLKPANFLLVRGRLKLIDFGIASSVNADMTSVVKNNPIGTLNYISPEALMDISGGNSNDSPNLNVKYKISFKSDVWSLGCILYSLVYGYTPFHNIRAQWAKVSAITNPHPKISFAPPAESDAEPTPPILIDVMRKCLQHDPKARPTVAQLLQIPYIPVKQIAPSPANPEIPANILMKIKYSLTDTEWRQFTEILEARRNQ